MSTSHTYVPHYLRYDGPSTYAKGKWVPGRAATIRQVRTGPDQMDRPRKLSEQKVLVPKRPMKPRSRAASIASTSDSSSKPDLREQPEEVREERHRNKAPKAVVVPGPEEPTVKPSGSFLSSISRLFFCCISTRPSYTKIQHLVIPTSQVCVDTKALRFLQFLPHQEFLLLNYIVQEVFTEDGVKVLGRIPDYDWLIESALRGQIRTVRRPWTVSERESYVEHTAGLYARLLRKLGTYENAPMCKEVYEKKLRGRWRW